MKVEFNLQTKLQLVVRASATASAHVEHVLEVCCYIGWRGATTASSVSVLQFAEPESRGGIPSEDMGSGCIR